MIKLVEDWFKLYEEDRQMTTVGAFEAKTNLSKLLEQVAGGERITITRHGVAIAMLVPVPGRPREDKSAVVKDILAFRKGRKLDGMSIREMIEEGRKR